MQNQIRAGLLLSVEDFTFSVPVADPTQLTFAIDDETKAQLVIRATASQGVTAGTSYAVDAGKVKVVGLAAGAVHVTATDHSSSGPQDSNALALTVSAGLAVTLT